MASNDAESALETLTIQDRTYQYSLRMELGRGAFGTVYEGQQAVRISLSVNY